MEISDYAHYAVFLHWLHTLRCFILLLLKWNIWLCSLRCYTSLTTLTTLFYFTTIKMKYLTTLTSLFYFITIKMKYLTTLTTLFFFTDYIHYAAFTSPLVNGNLWLRSLHCFTSLLLTLDISLPLLRCSYPLSTK